jgi:hypothetical protein
VRFAGTPGWGSKAFIRRETKITDFLKKRLGRQWKASEIVHDDCHEVVSAVTKHPDMADFPATLRADILRMFEVIVPVDWDETDSEEEEE